MPLLLHVRNSTNHNWYSHYLQALYNNNSNNNNNNVNNNINDTNKAHDVA